MSIINQGAVAQDKETHKVGEGGGAPFLSLKEGEHKVFICPPARGANLPYYPVAMHYTGDAGIVCANVERNSILKDPIFLKALKAAGKKIPDKCPHCEDEKPGMKFLMITVPLQVKEVKKAEFERYEEIEARPYLAPKQVWNGVADIILDVGDSVVDVNGPVFVKIKREGRTKTNTRYTVIADSKSLRDQKPLPKGVREMIAEAIAEDGPSDPYKILVNMFKSGEELEASAAGLDLDESGDDIFGDEPDEPEEKPKTEAKAAKGKGKSEKKPAEIKRPACFAVDYHADDTACQSCKIADECKAESESKGGNGNGDDKADASGDEKDDLDALLD